jgi:hypothetical protein
VDYVTIDGKKSDLYRLRKNHMVASTLKQESSSEVSFFDAPWLTDPTTKKFLGVQPLSQITLNKNGREISEKSFPAISVFSMIFAEGSNLALIGDTKWAYTHAELDKTGKKRTGNYMIFVGTMESPLTIQPYRIQFKNSDPFYCQLRAFSPDEKEIYFEKKFNFNAVKDLEHHSTKKLFAVLMKLSID